MAPKIEHTKYRLLEKSPVLAISIEFKRAKAIELLTITYNMSILFMVKISFVTAAVHLKINDVWANNKVFMACVSNDEGVG